MPAKFSGVGEGGPFVEQRARSELVFCDCRPFPEKGMVIPGERFGVLRHQELCPVANLIGAGIGAADVVRVALES